MLGLVRHARACLRPTKITKQQYLWEWLSYFTYLLHAVTRPWKLQCYHVVLVGYGPACPKFREAINYQYLWKGSCDSVDFLQVVICILLDIHWSYKNMLFWSGIVRHSLLANQIVRCCKLKKLKKDRYQVDFLLPLKLEGILCYFGLWLQNTLGQSVCRIFYFWLVWLVKLNTGGPLLQCTCSFLKLSVRLSLYVFAVSFCYLHCCMSVQIQELFTLVCHFCIRVSNLFYFSQNLGNVRVTLVNNEARISQCVKYNSFRCVRLIQVNV